MSRLLRSATRAPSHEKLHALHELAHLEQLSDHVGQVQEVQTRHRWSHVASVLLFTHAVSAVLYVSFVPAIDVGQGINVELIALVSLIVHMIIHLCFTRWTSVATGTRQGSSAPTRKASFQHLNGRYMKDGEASEPMDPLCDLMMITGIKRYALRFIVGSDVRFSACGEFSFAAFSVIKWFKIKESYALDGGPSKHRRRDLRGGGMRGVATLEVDGSKPVVTVVNRFGGFREGTLKETFTWPSDDVMEVFTVLENEFGRASFKQVFARSPSYPG